MPALMSSFCKPRADGEVVTERRRCGIASEETRKIVRAAVKQRLRLTAEHERVRMQGAEEERSMARCHLSDHVESLRRLSAELETKSGRQLFPRLLAQMDTSSRLAAEETYRQIAGELFNDGVQWGRIVALVAFTGYAAERSVSDGNELCHALITWLEDVIAGEHQGWIQNNGGWVRDVVLDAQPQFCYMTLPKTAQLKD